MKKRKKAMFFRGKLRFRQNEQKRVIDLCKIIELEKRRKKSMDKEFMKSFYERYYENPYGEAVKESEIYCELQKKRQEIEGVLESKIRAVGEEIILLFEEYMDILSDEQEVLLQEMYLMGAQDRERMLRDAI